MYTLGEDILNVENVSMELGGKLILRDINLNLRDIIRPGHTQGQIIALLSPSGRGKTTLFKIMAGLIKPTTGTVLLGPNKKPVTPGDVGVVAQNYPLFEYMTVWGNLEYVCHIIEIKEEGKPLSYFKKKTNTDAARKQKIEFYLDKFKMLEHKDKYPALLSGGQRQRIAIIQQMLCSEHFILMDEPFSGLDPLMKDQVCQIIETVANLDEKNTIIIVSHDIPSAISISQYIWILGYDYDEKGVPLPGARIKYVENLMDKGLAWKENLVDSTEYFAYARDIRNVFNEL